MAEKKEKVPKHIATFNNMSEDAKQVGNMMEMNHALAYNAAIIKNIGTKNGRLNYDLLKNDDKQIAVADDIAKHHIQAAQDFFKSKLAKGSEMEKQLLMNAYAGTTQGELRQLFNRYKDKLDLNTYNNVKTDLINPIRQKMATVAMAHLKRDHINDIVNYTKSGDIVNKDALGINEGATLLTMYKRDGGISADKLLTEGKFEDHQLKAYTKKKK